MSERFIPFSNGSEYDYWRDQNCARCKKDYDGHNATNPARPWEGPCPMETAITGAAISDGTIDRSLAERIGIVAEPYEHLGKCKELELR